MASTNRKRLETQTCCICGKRLPGEKAMHYCGNWYCRSCEDFLFDDAWEEFCEKYYEQIETQDSKAFE